MSNLVSTRLCLDKREKKDGTHAIKVAITKQTQVCYVSTDFSVEECHWNKDEEMVIVRHDRQYLNSTLSKIKVQIDDAIAAIQEKHSVSRKSAKEIKDMVVAYLNPKEHNVLVTDAFRRFMETKETAGTRRIYQSTLDKLEKYDPTAYFDDITAQWLTAFDRYMAETMKSKNARNIHLRNIRAVFNYAIDEELTEAKYPFRKFKMRGVETIKRSLTVEELRQVMSYPCDECQEKYRDMFVLTFYLMGINMVDLYGLREITNDGRVEYYRAKTHKLYTIKLEPEALEIINKYRGKKHLLDWADRYKSHTEFMHKMNRNLQQIGEVKRVGLGGKKVYKPLFPKLTTYWARHTWATIAAELDIPKETISAALGHEIGSRITSIYIRFDQKKVDAANRKVIDYVLQKG